MITFNLSTGRIDQNDTKVLSVTPKDSSGSAVTPSALTAVFTPPSGEAVTYNTGDFSASGGVYSVAHTFDESGVWTIKVTATDAGGRSEVETGRRRVYPS